jgi:hypothetical protein
VEGTRYLEQTWRARDFESAEHIEFAWKGVAYRIARPEQLGDVNFVLVLGADFEEQPLELVLVRKPGWGEAVRRIAGGRETLVLESEAEAESVGG